MSRFKVNIQRLFKALISGHPAAYWALVRMSMSPFTRLLDLAFSLATKHDLDAFSVGKCILICSPPRSGSTVIYQSITRAVDCGYVSNLHQIFPRTARIFIRKFGILLSKPTGFDSYYGHTKELLNVNEGNDLIEYWFQSSETEAIRRRFIDSVLSLRVNQGQPVIIKNLNTYNRLAMLHRAVPEVIFLRIRRENQKVIESELNAFYELGHFNPVPESLQDVDFSDPVKFAVDQILTIERTLDEQLAHVPESHVIHISYEKFCESPEEELSPLIERIGALSEGIELRKRLKASRPSKVSVADRAQIKSLLCKYPREARG